VEDHTGIIPCQAFDEVGKKMFGDMTATELAELKQKEVISLSLSLSLSLLHSLTLLL